MKQYAQDLIILGVTTFILTLTGTVIDNRQTPDTPPPVKNIDSIMRDTKLKTFQIKTLLFQSSEYRKDTIKTKKSRIN